MLRNNFLNMETITPDSIRIPHPTLTMPLMKTLKPLLVKFWSKKRRQDISIQTNMSWPLTKRL